MHCPACAKALNVQASDGLTVGRCPPVCRGSWLQEGQLAEAISTMQVARNAGAKLQVMLRRVDLSCLRPLDDTVQYGGRLRRVHQQVFAVHGMWLESGQIELIAQYCRGTPAMHALANALAGELRRARNGQFVRQTLRSRLLSGIVAVVYLLVVLLTTAN